MVGYNGPDLFPKMSALGRIICDIGEHGTSGEHFDDVDSDTLVLASALAVERVYFLYQTQGLEDAYKREGKLLLLFDFNESSTINWSYSAYVMRVI